MLSKFDRKVMEIVAVDVRYDIAAYRFIANAVTFSCKRLQVHRHVTALELLEGTREFAIQEFGVMASAVLCEWGLRSAHDVGQVVYLLINAGLLSASPEDHPEDFDIDFELGMPQECDLKTPLPVPQIDC